MDKEFRPLFNDPHAQTIAGSLFSPPRVPRSYTQYLKLEDHDELTFDISEPEGWKASDPTIVMIHGLCGSTKSCYLLRLTKMFYAKGMRCVRVNLRGCGSSRKYNKRYYHSGSSHDLLPVLVQLKNECPDSPIVLMGFSLGGNISLKLAGELGEEGSRYIHSLIAVNPPLDLYASIELFRKPENRFYEHYFYKYLRADVHYRHKKYDDLPDVRLPPKMSLYEFDEYYLAPSIGFKSAMEYYTDSSSRHYIPHITVPCKILLSEDDPIIDSSVISEIDLPDNVEAVLVKGGGHLGFLTKGKKIRWMDSMIEEWISKDLDYPEAI